MKPIPHHLPRAGRKAISLGVTLVITGAAAIIVYGILELAAFNSRVLVAVESRTENSKAAAALMEFASAQLAAHLGKIPETTNFATEARNFQFLDASGIFVGGQTAIGRGLIDTGTKVTLPDGTAVTGTRCEVCAWPQAPLPTDAIAPSPVSLVNGPAEMKNVRSIVVNNALNSLDPMVGSMYSTSAYVPLRCRIIGMPDSRGVRHNIHATALLWMRQGNLFRHMLYLNEVTYSMGSGLSLNFAGSIFSNKPMVYDLDNHADANMATKTGSFQFERLSAPQLFIAPTDQYVSYMTSGGYNAGTGSFNPPTVDPNVNIRHSGPIWMGRGDHDWTAGWTPFNEGNALNGALDSWTVANPGGTKAWNPLNVDSRPLYLTRQDVAGTVNGSDLSAFWQPHNATTTMLDSRNPALLKTHAPSFNGSYTTEANGFQAVLPDGVPAPGLARALIEPPSLVGGDGEPVAPARPELPKPRARANNPALWDQWAAYETTSATDLVNAESNKYGNKAGLYVYVDTEGATTVFTGAKAAAAYKAQPTPEAKSVWLTNNATKVLKFKDSNVISTSNVFYDTTRIDRGNNGTAMNGSINRSINSPTNALSTTNGDVTSKMDQSRVVRAVDIDMGALRKAIRTDGIVDGAGNPRSVGEAGAWTGVMYVDVANPMAATTATSSWGKTINRLSTELTYDVTTSTGAPVLDADGKPQVVQGKGFNGKTLTENINAKFHQTAVRFANATEIPDVSQPGADMSEPKSSIPGFTLATNAVAYSVGSVNADGNVDTYPSHPDATARENNATDPTGGAFHTPFSLVCDNHQYISPAYQGDLDASRRFSNSRGAEANNLATVTNLKDAKGLAFGDLATLLAINQPGSDGHNDSPGTPKNPYTGRPLFRSASSIELTMALVCGSNDLQQDGNMQCGPSTVFNLDYNNLRTKYAANGSTVVLFKTLYRPRQAPNSNGGSTWYGSTSNRYDPNLGRGFVPPGSPSVRSFRLYGFKLISEAEYNAMALPVAGSVVAGGPTTP